MINSMPNREEKRQRIPGQTVIADEPKAEETPIVSVRFPSGLTVHYEANEVEEVQHGYKILVNKGGDLVAIVNKTSGFIIEVGSPFAVETQEDQKKAAEIEAYEQALRDQVARGKEILNERTACEVQPSQPWPRDNSRPLTKPKEFTREHFYISIGLFVGSIVVLWMLVKLIEKILL